MRNLFNSVKRKPIRYNKFDLSFPNYFTADYGVLYPCLVKEVHAGEVIREFAESMIRTQPLRAPAFVRSDATVHFFFVPYRLVYEDWTKFIVRGKDGDTDYDKPFIRFTDVFKYDVASSVFYDGSLADYLNFKTFAEGDTVPTSSEVKVDMMPFNAYSLIYNEYYRDENLIPEVFIWKHSGNTENAEDYDDYMNEIRSSLQNPQSGDSLLQAQYLTLPFFLRRRAWRKDYFTSALPFVQKGTPISLAGAVQGAPGQTGVIVEWSASVPLQSNTPYFVNARRADGDDYNRVFPYFRQSTASATPPSSGAHSHNATADSGSTAAMQAVVPIAGLQTSVMTISDLRVGLALQQWFELNARTGSDRYFEYLLGHFGVRDRDSRLQRPEYLGGFSHSIQISEVEQTSSSDDVSPQGNLAGKGLGYSYSHPVRYRFPEPGYLMAIYSIRPQPVYWQGQPRMYSRWDSFDYYDPLFDHLSEQPIWTSELYFDWEYEPRGEDDKVFGYTPRFSEYRTSLPELHGDFRGNLRYWVSPRALSSAVELNRDFIEVDGYSQALYEHFAFIGDEQHQSHHFIVQLNHKISLLRPMSKYATPYL